MIEHIEEEELRKMSHKTLMSLHSVCVLFVCTCVVSPSKCFFLSVHPES